MARTNAERSRLAPKDVIGRYITRVRRNRTVGQGKKREKTKLQDIESLSKLQTYQLHSEKRKLSSGTYGGSGEGLVELEQRAFLLP